MLTDDELIAMLATLTPANRARLDADLAVLEEAAPGSYFLIVPRYRHAKRAQAPPAKPAPESAPRP